MEMPTSIYDDAKIAVKVSPELRQWAIEQAIKIMSPTGVADSANVITQAKKLIEYITDSQ